MSDDDEYPGIREALQSDAAINVYCGAKWCLWHLFHLLFVLVAIVFLAVVTAFWAILTLCEWGGYILERVLRAVYRFLAPRFPNVGGVVSPTYVKTRRRLDQANVSSQGTPVVRRIYGYCPVDIKANPKWADALGGAFDATAGRSVDALKPPTKYGVCTFCGHVEEEPGYSCGECYKRSRKYVYDMDDAEELSAEIREDND